MKCVFLDRSSVDQGDINFKSLDQVIPGWKSYTQTLPIQTAQRIANADIVISNKVRLDRKILAQAEKLKLICVAATGINNVEIEAASQANIAVCNVTAYATPSVAEHVFALILSLMRKLPQYQSLALTQWRQSSQFCVLGPTIGELAGKTLGIVGFGELGRRVAAIAAAFQMRVLIANRPGTSPTDSNRMPLKQLLPKVDILSLHCPLTEQTRNLIDKEQLAMMHKQSILINTARGGIVNEQALADALINGQIAGAALDVLTEEPPQKGNVLLDNIPNLIVTPHVAWASIQSRQRLMDQVAENIKSFLHGKVRNQVN